MQKIMISPQPQMTQPIASHQDDSAEPTRVAVLLTGYGEVESYRDLSSYNQAATKYIASQFVSISEWLYPAAGWLLGLQDWYNFGFKHHHFMFPENEIFEKQRIGIEQQLQDRWGDRVQVFKGFYFCNPFVQEVVTDSGMAGGDAGLLGIARTRRFTQANCTRIYHGHFNGRDRRRNSS